MSTGRSRFVSLPRRALRRPLKKPRPAASALKRSHGHPMNLNLLTKLHAMGAQMYEAIASSNKRDSDDFTAV